MNQDSPEQVVAEWGRGMRLVLSFLAVLALYLALGVYGNIPKMERIFEDMLGSKDKLPSDTLFLIKNHGLLQTLHICATALGITAIWLLHRPIQVCITACVLLALTMASWQLASHAITAPFHAILMGLSSGTP